MSGIRALSGRYSGSHGRKLWGKTGKTVNSLVTAARPRRAGLGMLVTTGE